MNQNDKCNRKHQEQNGSNNRKKSMLKDRIFETISLGEQRKNGRVKKAYVIIGIISKYWIPRRSREGEEK